MGVTQNNRLKPIAQVWRKSNVKKPALFLDRDGTIIRFVEILREKRHLKLLRGAAALRRLADDYFLILITNQPIIEKGIISIAQAKALNEQLRKLLAQKGMKLSAAYTCPHRHQSNCACRKAGVGLIRQAQKDFSIDMAKSWLIGDTRRDMECAKRAKLQSILVKTGKAGHDTEFFKSKGAYEVRDLRSAVDVICK